MPNSPLYSVPLRPSMHFPHHAVAPWLTGKLLLVPLQDDQLLNVGETEWNLFHSGEHWDKSRRTTAIWHIALCGGILIKSTSHCNSIRPLMGQVETCFHTEVWHCLCFSLPKRAKDLSKKPTFSWLQNWPQFLACLSVWVWVFFFFFSANALFFSERTPLLRWHGIYHLNINYVQTLVQRCCLC